MYSKRVWLVGEKHFGWTCDQPYGVLSCFLNIPMCCRCLLGIVEVFSLILFLSVPVFWGGLFILLLYLLPYLIHMLFLIKKKKITPQAPYCIINEKRKNNFLGTQGLKTNLAGKVEGSPQLKTCSRIWTKDPSLKCCQTNLFLASVQTERVQQSQKRFHQSQLLIQDFPSKERIQETPF